ncbi:MAG: hypothetical protein J5698_01920 [Bacteroidaceae bacterium]|nr:hypothetical protein [Bacteroidaceae bacterium]
MRQQLARAEQVMETDSRAAAAVLDSIDSSVLRGEEAALYAILRTQTDYKRDIPLTSDSLASIATLYYGVPHRKDYHAAMAWYTLGCVYKETKDDINGTAAFLKAKSLFPDTLIRYYALSEQNLALHYMNRSMKQEAIHELQSAKQNLKRLDDSATVAFMDYKLGQCYVYDEKYTPAKEALIKALQNPHARKYVINGSFFELAKVETYDTKDYSKAQEYLAYNFSHSSDIKGLSGSYSLKATVFQKQGLLDSAWHYYNRSLSCTPNLASFAYDYLQMASLAPLLGKTDSIDYYIQMHDKYVDSLYFVNNQQAIRQVANDHRVEMEQQQMEEQHRRLILLVSALCLVLGILLFSLFTYLRYLNKKKKLEIQDAVRQSNVEAMNLSALSEEETNEEESKEHDIIKHENIANTDAYIRLFLLGKKLLDPKAVDNLRKLDIFVKGEEANKVREDYLNALDYAFVELMMMLKLAVPSINKMELVYIISRMIGLDDKKIRAIQGSSESAYRTRKTRLKNKLPRELTEKLLSFEKDIKE